MRVGIRTMFACGEIGKFFMPPVKGDMKNIAPLSVCASANAIISAYQLSPTKAKAPLIAVLSLWWERVDSNYRPLIFEPFFV